MKVLVTNAEYKHALAAIRALGRVGMTVVSASQFKHAQGFYSRFSRKRFQTPPPTEEAKYVKFLRRTVREEDVDVVLPIGFDSVLALSSHIDDLGGAKVPISSREKVLQASNKARAMELARKNNVPFPETVEIDDPARPRIDGLEYPVVVKSDEGYGFHAYCNDRSQMKREVSNLKKLYSRMGGERGSIIVQEYIPGTGYGHFALLNRGRTRAVFQHRRLREFPTSGGSATKAVSVYDKRLKRLGQALLKALDWHGVAMVEFKHDARDGQFKLMEINPKFWGSLALAVKSGVNFPALASRMAYSGDVRRVKGYLTKVRYRWMFPDDTLHLLSSPTSLPGYLLDTLNPGIGSDNQLTDPLPTAVQIGDTFLRLGKAGEDRRARRPDKGGGDA